MVQYYSPGERGKNATIVARGYVNGKQYEVTTGQTNARLAKRHWKEFAAAINQSDRPGRPQNFGEVANAYLTAMDASENTRRYVDALKRELGTMLIQDVRPADLAWAANRIYPTGVAATKNRQVYAPGAAILHWAAHNEWCNYIRVRKLREDEPETRRPLPGVETLLLANSEGDQHDFLLFLFHQGWRVTESCNLACEHVDLRARTLGVYVGKARKWKEVVMHPATFEMLCTRNLTGKHVFPWRTRSGVYKWLWKLCKRLGVRFTPHMARHEFGGSLREVGGTGRDLKDLGTWTSTASTERYQHADSDHHRSLIAKRKARGK